MVKAERAGKKGKPRVKVLKFLEEADSHHSRYLPEPDLVLCLFLAYLGPEHPFPGSPSEWSSLSPQPRLLLCPLGPTPTPGARFRAVTIKGMPLLPVGLILGEDHLF